MSVRNHLGEEVQISEAYNIEQKRLQRIQERNNLRSQQSSNKDVRASLVQPPMKDLLVVES